VSVRINVLIFVFLLLFGPSSLIALSACAADAEEPRAGRVYRIGFLRAGPPPNAFVEAFQQGLRERGYNDGQNVFVEFRFTDGSVDQLPRLAEELLHSKVDVIVASAAAPALAAKKVTTSVPIVFVGVYDPIELGLIPSLARPGGNITGLAISFPELAGKRLELLKDLVPKLRRVAVLWDGANPTNPMQLKGTEIAASALRIELQPVVVRTQNDFDSAFKAMSSTDGLLVLESPFFTTHRTRLVGLAATSRVPAIYGYKEMVDAGGLMSYGAHYQDIYQRAAIYVDKILKGSNPADLPVEQPTKFELVINLKVAKAHGLSVPPSLLLRASQLIE
jgi:putative ABC transport system substrate-binding protein